VKGRLDELCVQVFNVTTLRSTSDKWQNRPTLSRSFIARQICLGSCRISIGKQSPNKHGFQHYRQRPGSLTLEFPGMNSVSLQLKINIG